MVEGDGGLAPETVLLAPGSELGPPVALGPAGPVPDGTVAEDDRVEVSSESCELGKPPPAPGLPLPIAGALVLLDSASLVLDEPSSLLVVEAGEFEEEAGESEEEDDVVAGGLE